MGKRFRGGGDENFRWLVGVFDLRSKEQICFAKNLNSKEFDSYIKDIKKKLK
jgi:hypothetical protein